MARWVLLAMILGAPPVVREAPAPAVAICAEPGLVERHLRRLSLAGAPSPVLDRVRKLCGTTK